MTRERIEDMREVVLPFVKKRLLETNYEGLGEADAKEFEREFNEILNLAIKALEQEPILDKLRAEIWDLQYGDEEKSMTDEDRADAYNNAIRQVIEIIDNYKAESEDT